MKKTSFAALALALCTGTAAAQSTSTSITAPSIVAPITVPSTTQTMTDALSGAATSSLDAYIGALAQVDALVRKWRPHVAAATSEAEAARLLQQANAQIDAVVAGAEGITVAEYRRIGQAAQRDPVLRDRINRLFRERTGN
jgi:hypothetical protein